MYKLIQPLLFHIDAERAHCLSLGFLNIAHCLGLSRWMLRVPTCQVRRVMGLDFPNPVGLAAGLDKNGDHIDALAALGFGFIEIGTVTPRPQPGNPKPRLFRITQSQAIINRFGFNNRGVDALVKNIQRSNYRGILGINIGKNFDTAVENATDDYLDCLRKVYAYASYVTVNVSSPNTKNLRQLQDKEALTGLLSSLKQEQQKLAEIHGEYVPIALKVAPDLSEQQIVEISSLLKQHRIDALIATNTTLDREEIKGMPDSSQSGGLSGAPLSKKSTKVVQQFSQALGGELPIIGVGGVMNANDAVQKINAGASLVQLYSGLIYRGPQLVGDICHALE